MPNSRRTTPANRDACSFTFLVRTAFSLQHTFDPEDVRLVRSTGKPVYAPTAPAIGMLELSFQELLVQQFAVSDVLAYATPRPQPKRRNFIVRAAFDLQYTFGSDEVRRLSPPRKNGFAPTEDALAWLEGEFSSLLLSEFSHLKLSAKSSPHLLMSIHQVDPPGDDLYFDDYWACNLMNRPSSTRATKAVVDRTHRWVARTRFLNSTPKHQRTHMRTKRPSREYPATRKFVLRQDATAGSGRTEIEKVFGLPKGSVQLLLPNGHHARADKTIRSLLSDWGW